MKRKKNKQKQKNPPDFKRVKRKVGKKKPTPTNSIVPKIKAKKLLIPEQSTTNEKGIVSVRNLNLDDLIRRLSHYNDQVRRDALLGILELCKSNHDHLFSNLGKILQKVIEFLIDPSKGVRQALIGFVTKIFPILGNSIVPFFPIYVVYITSALTHLSLEIRADGLALINLCIKHYPLTISKFHPELLPHYLSLLSINQVLATKTQLDLTSGRPNAFSFRILALSSLNEFLNCIFKLEDQVKEKPPNLVVTNNPNDYNWNESWNKIRLVYKPPPIYTFDEVFQDSKIQLQNAKTNKEKKEIKTDSKSKIDLETISGLIEFSDSLVVLLLRCWMECDPSDLNPNNLEPLGLVLRVLHWILERLHLRFLERQGRSGDHNQVRSQITKVMNRIGDQIKKHVTAYYPFEMKATWTAKEEALVKSVNILFCVVSSYFVTPRCNDEEWVTNLLESISQYFETKSKTRASPSETQITSLLPVIKRLSLQVSQPNKDDLLKSFSEFFLSLRPKSSHKQACINFIGEILLEKKVAIPLELAQQWVYSFPKVLWQIQDTSPSTSKSILDILCEYFSTCNPPDKDFNVLIQSIVPFFYTIISKKKAETDQEKTETKIYGPFVRLPIQIQRRSIELVYYLKSLNETLIRALVACATHPKVDISVVRYLLENISFPDRIPTVGAYLSFLLSILIRGSKNDDFEDKDKVSDSELLSRSDLLIDLVYRCTFSLGLEDKLLDLLVFQFAKIVKVEGIMVQRTIVSFLGRLLAHRFHRFPGKPAPTELNFLSTCIYNYYIELASAPKVSLDLGPCIDALVYHRDTFNGLLEMIRKDVEMNPPTRVETHKLFLSEFFSVVQKKFYDVFKKTVDVQAFLSLVEVFKKLGSEKEFVERLTLEIELLFGV